MSSKNNKNGFTLIELLAVILILGVIALIAIPVVTNIISESKKGAIKSSLNGIVKASENYQAVSELSGNSIQNNFVYDVSNIDYSGKINTGKFKYNTNNEVSALISIDKLCGYQDFNGNIEIGDVVGEYCVLNNRKISLEFSVDMTSGYVSENGRLSVKDNYIVNKNGDPFQIRGVGTGSFGAYADQKVTSATIDTLKSWGANAIRLQINPTSTWFSSYQYIGQETEILNKIYTSIDELLAKDLYVIIDWHNYEMSKYQTNSLDFFDRITTHYGDDERIIYEIGNEPTDDWNTIKSTSIEIINKIRVKAPNALVIVPAGTGDGRPDEAANDPIEKDNIAYAFHNYVYTGNYDYLTTAVRKGIPLVVTEWAPARTVDDGNAYKEDIANKFVQLMNNYGIGWTYFAITSQNGTGMPYCIVDKWNGTIENSSLTQSGEYLKKLLQNDGIIFSSVKSIMKAYDETFAFWQSDYRTKITKIITHNKIDNSILKNSLKSWNMSIINLDDVVAYILDDKTGNETYELHIAANGKIFLPEFSSYLFKDFTSLKEINLENMDSSLATNINSMFKGDSQLLEADLSNFNFDKVINFSNLFNGCTNINKVVFDSNINTSNGTTFVYMFSNCSKLNNIVNINKFNTSSAIDISGMFGTMGSLTNLDISNYVTPNVTAMNYLFGYNSKLTNLDISNFTFDKVTSTTKMLQSIPTSSTIYVKNQAAVDFLKTIRSDLNYTIK